MAKADRTDLHELADLPGRISGNIDKR